jgi:nucleoside 2-deoxyribosyltransferase
MVLAYISIGYQQQSKKREEVEAIKAVLKDFAIEPTVFVDDYTFESSQQNEMMAAALAAIYRCDLLIADGSEKAIGIGIEAGYAKAAAIPVIYLRQAAAEASTTLGGIADYTLVYADPSDLKRQLYDLLRQVMTTLHDLKKQVWGLNKLILQGDTLRAIEIYYAGAVEMQENEEPPIRGKELCLERERINRSKVKAVQTRLLNQSINLRTQVVFSEWELMITYPDNQQTMLREVSVQQWQLGQIIREKFYYKGFIQLK